MQDRSSAGVRAALNALIKAGTSGDLGALDRIYHKDMQILMMDAEGTLNRFDKPGFIAMLEETVRKAETPPGTWADFHTVNAEGDRGHVLVTRKVNLGEDRILFLSIDLVHEDARWQVTREVIFSRPNPEGTPVAASGELEGTHHA